MEEHLTTWSVTCARPLQQAHTVEERMGAVRAAPVPTNAEGGAVPDADAQAAYDGVAWDAAKNNGSLWSGWRGPNHRVGEFEIAPAALALAATRSFTRVRDAECSPDGYVCENAYGAPLRYAVPHATRRARECAPALS